MYEWAETAWQIAAYARSIIGQPRGRPSAANGNREGEIFQEVGCTISRKRFRSVLRVITVSPKPGLDSIRHSIIESSSQSLLACRHVSRRDMADKQHLLTLARAAIQA